jgi:hypothetical protein
MLMTSPIDIVLNAILKKTATRPTTTTYNVYAMYEYREWLRRWMIDVQMLLSIYIICKTRIKSSKREIIGKMFTIGTTLISVMKIYVLWICNVRWRGLKCSNM